MTIEPAIIVAFMAALLGLLGLVLRMFIAGDLLSKNVVRREAYDRQLGIVDSYTAKFTEQTEAVKALTATVATLTATVERHSATIERQQTLIERLNETKSVSSRRRQSNRA